MLLAPLIASIIQLTVCAQTDESLAQSINWTERIQESIVRFQIWQEGVSRPIPMVSVLKWNNAAKDKRVGNRLIVFYAHKGERPVASCNVYPNDLGMMHAFCSHSTKPLTCTLNKEVVWRPESSKLDFRPIPKSDAPRASASLQRIQLKSLARRFGARTSPREASFKAAVPKLRLLDQPLYRYGGEKNKVTAGAVFGYRVGGSGPAQVLLFIEAVKQSSKRQWQYAFARRNRGPLTGLLDGKQVWTVEGIHGPTRRDSDTFFKVQTKS